MTDTTAPRRATAWQTARVVAIRTETPSAKTFTLALERPAERSAGQHFLLRLTAPDGYTATRSYSVANDPQHTDQIDLTVERLVDGEVSTFLHDEVVVGDEIEVRGPIGEWFVWDGDGRALLLGGGSGVVPLAAMVRQARRTQVGGESRVHLVLSVRSAAELYYADELPGRDVTIVYTRAAPPDFARPPGRLATGDLPRDFLADITTYVCGSPGFCDAATDLAIACGIPVERIRVERFGPTG
ncbi:MAG TPA: FAD-binding oxidoreductase [Acidimicrobiia bacterium]|nr:FAD-binding oxidoreductase [Acidimicrobiia bacterium]